MGRALDVEEFQPASTDPVDWLVPPLRVVGRSVYRGPHLYSRTPMIRIQVQLGALEDYPTDKMPGFTERLLDALPGLVSHGCSTGEPGGLVRRLHDGTWLGHVIEHVALELQSLAGDAVTRGKTRSVKEVRGAYNILYAYHDEAVGLLAGRLALDLVASLLDEPLNHFKALDRVWKLERRLTFTQGVELLRRTARQARLGPSTGALVREADRRGIPWERLDQYSFIRLGTGRAQKRLRAGVTAGTSHLGVETAANKDLTKKMLEHIGLPVPRGGVAATAEEALALAGRIGWPLVVKPLDGNHGRGVSTALSTPEELRAAFAIAHAISRRVVVEKFLEGRDYRALVVGGRVVAVAERVPAQVTGDGAQTVEQLVSEANRDPRRGDGHAEVMTRIALDAHALRVLGRQGLSLDAVPAKGRLVSLRQTANLSSGGSAIDRSDEIHPDNEAAAVRAAQMIGLDVAGIDFILPDIGKSWRQSGGGIVEVNAGPGLRMHLAPSQGRPRNVARPVLDLLFPEGAAATIPLVAITGTNGKSTTVRMVASILRRKYRNVGLTSTSGVFRNGECLWKGDASGPRSARMLLRDPTLDAVVLETARGGILREGLAFPFCDVGAVLNVSEDHLGLDGVATVEDLAQVKSVVTESVRPGGVSVLNADDPRTRHIARYAGGRVCFFSMWGTGGLQDHLAAGGLAVTLQPDGRIVLHEGEASAPVLDAAAIPATLGGTARFNIENALAAVGIAAGLGIAREDIAAGLAAFSSSFEQNPGRLNIHDEHGFRVVMDYAHNPAALRAFLAAINEMRLRYNRVLGAISTPGDRRTEDIKEMGRIAAPAFDFVVFRELPDNRGRQPGEVLDLLQQGAIEAGADPRKIVCVGPEEEATDICLRNARPGDLVVLTPTKVEATWEQMRNFRPAPAWPQSCQSEAAHA